ncbi:Uncharacterized protein BP5553_04107 [Venustampulla echinocandica]|uniref:DUF8021 domain-containing protein n=1 Tax=Venustampulla echinocandica TaxID=2656787 RepID=A0A370TW70_9HELO|nr:Uncharacterized protein BP5553_04107 [Venustampulla echinocandica]RDL39767.1 Uncharacterized protein BP5553_04107 [Venustampulla echinocandica]
MLSSLILLSLATAISAECHREFLKNSTDTYINAQTLGQYENVKSLIFDFAPYNENNIPTALEGGILATPIKIDFARSVHDTVQCATFTELIAASNPHPYVIHTRMEFDANKMKASRIESIVTDKGDWLFNATGTLALNEPEKWDAIPKAQQDSRAVIQSIGDAYFDRFGNVSVVVPWGPPCYRVEGGLPAKGTLTASGDCVMEWPSTIHVPYRRYVVDEQYGVVSLFVGFPGLDRTQGEDPMPDSHVFRVEGGKLKYLHTASACVVEGCGLNSTFGGGL